MSLIDTVRLPSFCLVGRVALVTGAARGIGRGLVDALAAAGTTVAVTARTLDDAETVAAEVGAAGGTASAHALDVIDVASIPGAVDAVVDRHAASTS